MLDRLRNIVKDVNYKENYSLICAREEIGGRVYIQVKCYRPCVYTGEWEHGYGGKIYLSPHMTDGEIVRKAFQAFLGYEEHECREFFTYKGARVFGPHIHIDALVEAAGHLEHRE